jgi:hypothetical protein
MDATERTEKATTLVELWEVIAEDDPAADNLLRAAQVHATLALAEQQRIANLQVYADGLSREIKNDPPERGSTYEHYLAHVLKAVGEEADDGADL